MRVMFLSPSGQLGGAETSLLEILASLRRGQPSWPLHLLLAAEGPLEARAAALGVTTVMLPFGRSTACLGESGAVARRRWSGLSAQLALAALPVAAYLARMRRAIGRIDPDVVHSNGLKMHVLAAQARSRARVVWHLHDYLGSRPLSARLLGWNRTRCAAIIANSNSVAADARHVLGSDVKVVTVYNGIDLQRFSPIGPRLDLDAIAGVSAPAAGTLRVGLLATFARWKGHETFLDAIARVPRDIPLRAYLVGDAVYQTADSQYTRQALMDLVTARGLDDRVVFTGAVDRPDAALRALDIVVHASTAPEPFGLVIAEAMACARPVIVSLAGGAAEIVSDGVDALGHAPGDIEGLAARIVQLARDPSLRLRLGQAARSTAERAFDRTRLSDELVPLYREVVRRRPS